MSRTIRVLVVDDSALMRTVITRLLREAGMEVVAGARNGEDALAKARQYRPDVITLDIEMPGMDGLTVLRRLLPELPIPVVMVSSLTQENAPATIEALSLGAVDVVGKPGGSIVRDLGPIEEELVRKVRVAASARLRPFRRPPEAERPRTRTGRRPLGGRPLSRRTPATTSRREPSRSATGDAAPHDEAKPQKRSERIVVIAISTGGPGALAELIPSLPGDLSAPVVVVQHMPPGFTESLANRLNRLSDLAVAEAEEGHIPQPGEVWVARGGHHLVFDAEGRMLLSDAAPHLNVRPAADLTIESAVDVWGAGVVTVIMTGMGMDGTRGSQRVRRAGGYVIAQDEESSVVYGMPRAVAEFGITHRICSLPEIPAAIVDALKRTEEDALVRAGG